MDQTVLLPSRLSAGADAETEIGGSVNLEDIVGSRVMITPQSVREMCVSNRILFMYYISNIEM